MRQWPASIRIKVSIDHPQPRVRPRCPVSRYPVIEPIGATRLPRPRMGPVTDCSKGAGHGAYKRLSTPGRFPRNRIAGILTG